MNDTAFSDLISIGTLTREFSETLRSFHTQICMVSIFVNPIGVRILGYSEKMHKNKKKVQQIKFP